MRVGIDSINDQQQSAVFQGTVSNGLVSGNFLNRFKKKAPKFAAQIALLLTDSLTVILGIFSPVPFPVFAAAKAAAVAEAEQVNQITQVAVARPIWVAN